MRIVIPILTDLEVLINIQDYVRETSEDFLNAIDTFCYLTIFLVRLNFKRSFYRHFADEIKPFLNQVNNDLVIETGVHKKQRDHEVH
jgi:hypothetical protein